MTLFEKQAIILTAFCVWLVFWTWFCFGRRK